MVNEKNKHIKDKRMPWVYFHLPFDKPFSKRVFLDRGDSVVVFKKNKNIINFYSDRHDNSVFTLSYDFEKSKWMMWLHDENTDWIPKDGCEWRFIVNNVNNSETILDESGTLEFADE